MSEKPKRSTLPTGPNTFPGRFWEQIRLSWLLFQDNRVSLGAKLIPIIAIAYLISPFGFIPALIPIIGQIDVLAVVMITVALFNGAAPKDVVTEYLTQMRSHVKPGWKVARDEGGTVLDNRMHIVTEDTETSDTDHSQFAEGDRTDSEAAAEEITAPHIEKHGGLDL